MFLVAEHAGRASTHKSGISASTSGTIAYAAALSPKGRLMWFVRTGRPLDSIGVEGYYSDFRLSPSENLLAASLLDAKTGVIEIWIMDLARGSNIRLTTEGATLEANPIWSPDGSQFLFRRYRGAVELYRRSAFGGGREQVVLSHQVIREARIPSITVIDTDWSPDGKNVIFTVPNLSSGNDLWLLGLTGDKKPVRLLATPADEMHGNFSPDGRLVAYTTNESGKLQVNVETLPLSDKKWQVSTAGGYEPRWRADGHEIYYLSEDRKLMAVAVGEGPSFGVPRALFQTRVPPGVTATRTHYVPSRDGQRFVINIQTGDTSPTPITVVIELGARAQKIVQLPSHSCTSRFISDSLRVQFYCARGSRVICRPSQSDPLGRRVNSRAVGRGEDRGYC